MVVRERTRPASMATAATVRCEARAGDGAGHTVAHRISPCLPGREMGVGGVPAESVWVSFAAGAGGAGVPAEVYGYPPAGGAGGGAGEVHGYPLSLAEMPATRSKVVGALETGEGELVPPPREPPPPVAISPRSTAWGDPGEEPDTAARLISQALPLPRGGAGAERRRRGQGMPARSKMVGVWETGEGEQVPPPRRPLPPWRYPHGPAHGEIPEKTRARFPIGSTPDTAAPLISQALPLPPGGRGRSAAGAGGVGDAGRSAWASSYRGATGAGEAGRSAWASSYRGAAGAGVPEKCTGIPAKARAGWGCRRGIRVSLMKARAGWGGASRRVWVSPCRRHGRGGGGQQRCMGSLPAGGAGKGCWREVRWLER